MDAVSALRSLSSLAITIITWIDQIREKKEILSQISTTVTTIHSIFTSFLENTTKLDLEPSLLNALLGLGDILSRTREHIAVFRKPRSVDSIINFIIPVRVSQQLVRDQVQLSQQLTIIIFSLSSLSSIRERFLQVDKREHPVSSRAIQNQDAFEFWRDYIGEKIMHARDDRFLEALKLCFGNWLSDDTRRRILLCLDEFKTGGVAASALERFVGESTLKDAIEKFHFYDFPPPYTSSPGDQKLPLLLWVDDRPENIAAHVSFAESKGVHVLQFTTTALFKAWVEDNEDFLRANDSPDTIRFISDTARFEPVNNNHLNNDTAYFNIMAGENVARYLRGRLYHAPLLIFCSVSGIIHTEYAEAYEATGSTWDSRIVDAYITALSDRIKDDEDWQGHDVQSELAGRRLQTMVP
ncbi:hypothetical protein C0991_002128 [Blastosporella zonata]|nr:hypothetical protein C0991_002128 [Blastosporella zonata]